MEELYSTLYSGIREEAVREIKIRLKKKGEKRKNRREETLITWASKEIAAKVLLGETRRF